MDNHQTLWDKAETQKIKQISPQIDRVKFKNESALRLRDQPINSTVKLVNTATKEENELKLHPFHKPRSEQLK